MKRRCGDRQNVIPDLAVAKADVRVVTPEEFDRGERDLNALAQKKSIPACEVTVKLTRLFSPFLRSAATEALVARVVPLYAELEKTSARSPRAARPTAASPRASARRPWMASDSSAAGATASTNISSSRASRRAFICWRAS